MNAHWIATWPLSGIASALAAAAFAAWAIYRKTSRLLWPLTGLIFSAAALNAYAEAWPPPKQIGFAYAAPILILLFALPYRSLCLRLVERTGLRPGLSKEQYSSLLPFYAVPAAVVVAVLFLATGGNRAYALFAFIVFACALHVPMFAFGWGKIGGLLGKPGRAASKDVPDISWGFLGTATAVLGVPLVLTLIIQVVARENYRLFVADAVLTATILALLAISRRGRFVEHFPER